ncbi:MAG TPA: metal ABC transporter ATP-binding protein [Candidatus Saccharimonadales bacterium]|nr:metal ABC transporter ATP-binding protein [Candidatus Saccharimonadales bacterium]
MLIDADNIAVVFNAEPAIEDVSLCVHSGEFIGLIGPNGAGKTTLLKVLLGLQKPTRGTVRMVKKGGIGYIPQRTAMQHNQMPISVAEVVALGSNGNVLKAGNALQAVGLQDLAKKRFSELSGGQQQRVFIAKALAHEPSILVLDEPTTGVDEHSQQEFYHILQSLQSRGMTIIMVSHDVDTVLSLVTRVVCLNRSIVYDGPPEHFETDKYLPNLYTTKHRVLHHRHKDSHA